MLDPVFSKVLILVVRLNLTIINAVVLHDLLDLVADFDLCPITDELSGGSPCLDLVFQC